jgi:hypothetical protein
MSNHDGVELVDVSFNCGQARKRFAFTEAGVDEDASAFAFEKRQISRTA